MLWNVRLRPKKSLGLHTVAIRILIICLNFDLSICLEICMSRSLGFFVRFGGRYLMQPSVCLYPSVVISRVGHHLQPSWGGWCRSMCNSLAVNSYSRVATLVELLVASGYTLVLTPLLHRVYVVCCPCLQPHPNAGDHSLLFASSVILGYFG
jgi:hypothetical protein